MASAINENFSPSAPPNKTPAQKLVGKSFMGWKVIEEIAINPEATGGIFSINYVVESETNNDKAFLKATDLASSMRDLEKLRDDLNNHAYEVNLLKICEDNYMDGIVRSLTSGTYEEEVIPGIIIPVPYIIFELAETDIRQHQDSKEFNLGWRLRIFHGVCVAMRQLHLLEIAHQDLKPSNVLVFPKGKVKIADLGRATLRNKPSNFEKDSHVGDANYIPLELLYGEYNSSNWITRRLGADFFMMGCLLTYLVTDSSLLTLLYTNLDKKF